MGYPSLFPPTQWGMVLQSADSESLETERALAELCQRYWQPVYTFIRGPGFNVEDAEDLTHGFFRPHSQRRLVRPGGCNTWKVSHLFVEVVDELH